MSDWLQYTVTLENEDCKLYLDAPITRIKRTMNKLHSDGGLTNRFTYTDQNHQISFIIGKPSTLEIKARNWGYAVKLIHKIGLPLPEILVNFE
tara:strand:+ start:637 stop:915 length:279 start_codon:yes stop_codon:yes gene_type:complete